MNGAVVAAAAVGVAVAAAAVGSKTALLLFLLQTTATLKVA
jgi:hypothetical protein